MDLEELKRKAVEKIRELMKKEYEEGYREGLRVMAEGKINLVVAEQLCIEEEPTIEELQGKSEEYVKGFRDAVEYVLSEASKEEQKQI